MHYKLVGVRRMWRNAALEQWVHSNLIFFYAEYIIFKSVTNFEQKYLKIEPMGKGKDHNF